MCLAQRRVAQGGTPVHQVDAQRSPYDVAGADAHELPLGELGGAHDLRVRVGRTDVEGVGGAPGQVLRQPPGAQHAVGGLVGDHHRGHPGTAGPPAGPAQRRTVGDLQAVGGEVLQESRDPPLVDEHTVAAGAGQHRAGQGDHAALLGLAVAVLLTGYDENRVVTRQLEALAQLAQRGTQPSGSGGYEVRQPDDAQRGVHAIAWRGVHTATAGLRALSTAS